MRNPLTRGKGLEAVKIVKGLTGISSFLGSGVDKKKLRFERSPERGLGHLVRESGSRPGVKFREMPFSRVDSYLKVQS
mgnify:CR=1 FL=1